MVVRLSLESPELRAIAVQQLRTCARNGMPVAGYLWEYPTTPFSDVDQVISLAHDAGAELMTLWLDAEQQGVGVAELRPEVDRCHELEIPSGIYTSEGYWFTIGNPDDFGDEPLWIAHYTGQPDLESAPSFGGWKKRAGHQYRADAQIAGLTVDLNIFRSSILFV